jgi:hypothetical protein
VERAREEERMREEVDLSREIKFIRQEFCDGGSIGVISRVAMLYCIRDRRFSLRAV